MTVKSVGDRKKTSSAFVTVDVVTHYAVKVGEFPGQKFI
jgi:hypothetical protein